MPSTISSQDSSKLSDITNIGDRISEEGIITRKRKKAHELNNNVSKRLRPVVERKRNSVYLLDIGLKKKGIQTSVLWLPGNSWYKKLKK